MKGQTGFKWLMVQPSGICEFLKTKEFFDHST